MTSQMVRYLSLAIDETLTIASRKKPVLSQKTWYHMGKDRGRTESTKEKDRKEGHLKKEREWSWVQRGVKTLQVLLRSLLAITPYGVSSTSVHRFDGVVRNNNHMINSSI